MSATVAVAAVQNELSLTFPGRMAEPADIGRAGAMFMAHFPLGRGLLTGRSERASAPGDLRSGMPQFRSDAATATAHHLQAIDEVADRHATSRAAIALAWVLGTGENVVPIPGARAPEHIEAAIKAARIVLTSQDVVCLATTHEPIEPDRDDHGEKPRYRP